MEKNRYILFTAGRGPVECQLAVHGIQMKFKQMLERGKVKYELVKQQRGQLQGTTETVVFKIESNKTFRLDDWIGTILWISKSPIRKYTKRKNWYVKCCEISMPEMKPVKLENLSIQAYKASGPGGQHRNKVETAIRVIHKGTGVTVTEAGSRSKTQNKKKALEKMGEKLRLFNREKQMGYELDVWTSKIEIERGSPVRIFHGPKFREG